MGGRLVSFGSDCHQKERLGENYPVVVSMLKLMGFKEFVYFENKVQKTFKL